MLISDFLVQIVLSILTLFYSCYITDDAIAYFTELVVCNILDHASEQTLFIFTGFYSFERLGAYVRCILAFIECNY